MKTTLHASADRKLRLIPSSLWFIDLHSFENFDNKVIRNAGSSFNMGVLGTMARHLDTILGPGVMLLYPLYASMRAIESPSTLDDQQWLTYWILYSFLTLFELSCYRILAWFPIWSLVKLVICMWLVLPMFNGAAYIYENYVRQYVKKIESYGYSNSASSNYPEEYKKVLHMMTFDARKAVERYIDRYGPDSFERVIKAAEKEARKH